MRMNAWGPIATFGSVQADAPVFRPPVVSETYVSSGGRVALIQATAAAAVPMFAYPIVNATRVPTWGAGMSSVTVRFMSGDSTRNAPPEGTSTPVPSLAGRRDDHEPRLAARAEE